MFVGPIVVNDQMQVEPRRRFSVDSLEETDELLVSMPWHAITDDFAIEHTQSRKQRSCAVALVVVRHGPTSAFLQGKTRLGTVEGLNLTFLVDTQDQGPVRWIEVQADDIIELLDELFIAADLESFGQMRFQAVSIPNPFHSHPADPLRFRHAAYAPMSCIRWSRMQCGLHDGSDFVLGDARNATWSWCILAEPFQTKGKKTLSPELDRRSGNLQCMCDVLVEDTIRSHRDDLSALNQTQGNTPPACPHIQDRPLFGRQNNGTCNLHGAHYSLYRSISQDNYGTLH